MIARIRALALVGNPSLPANPQPIASNARNSRSIRGSIALRPRGRQPRRAPPAGINVDRIKILGFALSGMCAALTGILLASRLGSGTTSAADGYLSTDFAAVFLGSATLRDGEFHIVGTFAGALIIAFGFIINPDDLRDAFDASVEHRLTLLDGDCDNIVPGIHVRFGEGHTLGQQFVILETARGRLVISGDCVYDVRNIKGYNNDGVYVPLANGVGSIWEQLKTMDRINTDIGGGMNRLIILHDNRRWPELPLVREIEGFRILKAS